VTVEIASVRLPERQWLIACFVLAFVLRAAFALGYWSDKPLTVDQTEYLMLAENLRAGEGFVYDEPRLMRSPGYPVFLAAVQTIMPGTQSVRLVQSLLGALAVLLVAALARGMAGPRAAVVGALLMTLYPPQVFQPAYILSESLYTALALATLLACVRLARMPATSGSALPLRELVTAGVLAGITVLTRPEFLLFLGLLGLYLAATRRVLLTVALAAVVIVTIAPWPLYNITAHDRVVMLSSRGGPNLWMGNNPLALGDGDVGANPPMRAEYDSILRENQQLTPEEIEKVFYGEAFAYARADPLGFATNIARKAGYFWAPIGPSYRARSPLFWGAQALSFLALLGLAAAAIPGLRRLRPPPIVLGLLLVSVYLTCLIFFPLVRYRVPVFDPVLMAGAATLWGMRS